jgi:hypothetical protein
VYGTLDVSDRYPNTSLWLDGQSGELLAFEAATGGSGGSNAASASGEPRSRPEPGEAGTPLPHGSRFGLVDASTPSSNGCDVTTAPPYAWR